MIRFDDEEIPLYVASGENNVFPSILNYEFAPSFEAVLINCVRSVNSEKREVEEPALCGRKSESSLNEFGCDNAGGSEAERE